MICLEYIPFVITWGQQSGKTTYWFPPFSKTVFRVRSKSVLFLWHSVHNACKLLCSDLWILWIIFFKIHKIYKSRSEIFILRGHCLCNINAKVWVAKMILGPKIVMFYLWILWILKKIIQKIHKSRVSQRPCWSISCKSHVDLLFLWFVKYILLQIQY